MDGLVRSGSVRLEDSKNASLSLESRFDLAYNAARSSSRSIDFGVDSRAVDQMRPAG